MSRKKKSILLIIFAAVIVAAGAAGWFLNQKETQPGTKTFQLEIVSERDDFRQSEECRSEKEYLGQFLREFDECEWDEGQYGIYIRGLCGMEEDLADQYWWSILVNGEKSTTGADQIPLRDGDIYTLELKQGW